MMNDDVWLDGLRREVLFWVSRREMCHCCWGGQMSSVLVRDTDGFFCVEELPGSIGWLRRVV